MDGQKCPLCPNSVKWQPEKHCLTNNPDKAPQYIKDAKAQAAVSVNAVRRDIVIDQLAPDQEAVQTAKKKNNTKEAKSVETILTTNNEDSTEGVEVDISEFHGEVAAQAAGHEELTYDTFDSIFLDCSSNWFKEGFSWKSSNTKYPAIFLKKYGWV